MKQNMMNLHKGFTQFRNYFLTTTKQQNNVINNTINLQRLILSNTKLSKNHLTPEILLYLITPECELYYEPYSENKFLFKNDPFWGFYWPGGQALSRYILDHPDIVKSKSVLDIGCGSGACSIASMLSGAKHAIANDIDEVATQAAIINAQLNNVTIQTRNENLIGKENIKEDIILLGDIFYDTEISEILFPWLFKLKDNRKLILIGDPGRHGINQDKLKYLIKLKSYGLPKNVCLENNGFQFANVLEFI